MIHELGYRDKVIIPDKYNTGPVAGTVFISANEYLHDPSTYIYIGGKTISDYGDTFENLRFTHTVVFKKGTGQINQPVYFKNCLFDAEFDTYCFSTNGTGGDSQFKLIFDHCEFKRFGSAANQPGGTQIFTNCKIHTSHGDGGKGSIDNGGFENCYFYDLGYDSPSAHADGIQTTGGNTNFYIKNCRFDVPVTQDNVSNAGIFFVQEYDSVNAEIKDILINGGNYSLYIGIKEGKTATITGLTGSNIKIGASYTYGRASITDAQYQNWNSNGTITNQDKLFVSSVFMGANGKIKVIVSNYTESARTLILVSDKETQTYTVPAHPTSEQLSNLTFDDLPYDLEYEVEGNYVICYDGSISDANEIRFAYATVSQLFSDIADAVRTKTGSQDLIPRQGLPKEISSITGSATLGTKSITANGTYNASSDNLDGYSAVTVNVSGLPSYMSITDITVQSDSETIDVPYDSSREVFSVMLYNTNFNENTDRTITGEWIKKKTLKDSGTDDYMGASSMVAGSNDTLALYGTPTWDAVNGVVTILGRAGRYFRANKTYRAIIIYTE